MWQDGVALFIVVIAALALLQACVPRGVFRITARRQSSRDSVNSAAPTGVCSGCTSGSSRFKGQN